MPFERKHSKGNFTVNIMRGIEEESQHDTSLPSAKLREEPVHFDTNFCCTMRVSNDFAKVMTSATATRDRPISVRLS